MESNKHVYIAQPVAVDVPGMLLIGEAGLVHNHFGQALPNNSDSSLGVSFQGTVANAQVSYQGKAFVRGGPSTTAVDTVLPWERAQVRWPKVTGDEALVKHIWVPTDGRADMFAQFPKKGGSRGSRPLRWND